MTRRSLRDRNRDAMTPDPTQEPATPKAGNPDAARALPGPGKATTKTARLGIYLTPDEFTAAKAAYLADWNNGGQADTFARWIAQALEAHARREPARSRLSTPRTLLRTWSQWHASMRRTVTTARVPLGTQPGTSY